MNKQAMSELTRRNFLGRLGLGLAALATPPVFFDMGAAWKKHDSGLYLQVYCEEVDIPAGLRATPIRRLVHIRISYEDAEGQVLTQSRIIREIQTPGRDCVWNPENAREALQTRQGLDKLLREGV